MKIKRNLIQTCLPAVVLLQVLSTACASQTGFINLFNFDGSNGADPQASLILYGGTLYGTTPESGPLATGYGTLFKINADGTGFTNLYHFSATTADPSIGANTNSDGAYPKAGLILSGNTLYGTATSGGSWGNGTVFAIHTDGTGFTNLFSFNGSDGAGPYGGSLRIVGSTLYGTTIRGGSGGSGTVFTINTDGTGFTNLYSFSGNANNGQNNYTNSDGADPQSSVILSSSTLYGTTIQGGYGGNGTVFAINTNGTGFTNFYSFTASANNGQYIYTNNDGTSPLAGLLIAGSKLFGMTSGGGNGGSGTLFAINIDGTGLTNLHTFTMGANNGQGAYTNSDGIAPYGSLILAGSTLYGTASQGGNAGSGTVFAINTDGTGFTNLYSFTATTPSFGIGTGLTNSDGAFPASSLILDGSTLYGTTYQGGSEGYGTLFKLTIPITLFYHKTASAIILSWNDPSFLLQIAPAVTGTYTNIPGATTPYTNTLAGPQKFFRLLASQ